MKNFKFLIFVGITAILLSGCKSSETSEISETGVSSVSSSGSQSDSQSVVSSTSTTTSTTTSTSSSIVSSTSSSRSSSAVVSSSTVSTSTQSSTAVESSSSTTSSEPQPVVSEPDPEPAWTETPASGTMYVNLNGIYNRKQAIQGSEKVRQFSLNEEVTVTAKTDTNYYKIEDGTFIHSDYLSSSKIVYEEPKPATPITPSGNGPVTGDIKIENGQKYMYDELFGWIECGEGSTHEPSDYVPNPKYDYEDPDAY